VKPGDGDEAAYELGGYEHLMGQDKAPLMAAEPSNHHSSGLGESLEAQLWAEFLQCEAMHDSKSMQPRLSSPRYDPIPDIAIHYEGKQPS
jgi:hypothetical protein